MQQPKKDGSWTLWLFFAGIFLFTMIAAAVFENDSLGWLQVIFAVIIAIIVIGLQVLFVIEIFGEKFKIRKLRKQWEVEHGKQLKKRCIHCHYCRTSISRTFYTPKYRNVLAQKVPSYCRKFSCRLRRDIDLRCIAEYPSKIEYEDKE